VSGAKRLAHDGALRGPFILPRAWLPWRSRFSRRPWALHLTMRLEFGGFPWLFLAEFAAAKIRRPALSCVHGLCAHTWPPRDLGLRSIHRSDGPGRCPVSRRARITPLSGLCKCRKLHEVVNLARDTTPPKQAGTCQNRARPVLNNLPWEIQVIAPPGPLSAWELITMDNHLEVSARNRRRLVQFVFDDPRVRLSRAVFRPRQEKVSFRASFPSLSTLRRQVLGVLQVQKCLGSRTVSSSQRQRHVIQAVGPATFRRDSNRSPFP